MPDTTPMTPPRRHRAARTTSVVVGAIVGLIAFGMLAIGGVLLWADSKKDEQGYIHTDTERFATRTAAIATDNLDVDSHGLGWLTSHDHYGNVRLEVSPRNDKAGLRRHRPHQGRLRLPARHLAHHGDRLPLRSVPCRLPRRARLRPRLAAPVSKRIWVASAHGTGMQTVTWDVKHGDWSVVVMNADGSRGVDTGVSAGADFPILSALAWGSVGGGLVLLGVAVAADRRGHHGAAPRSGPRARARLRRWRA